MRESSHISSQHASGNCGTLMPRSYPLKHLAKNSADCRGGAMPLMSPQCALCKEAPPQLSNKAQFSGMLPGTQQQSWTGG